MRLNISIKSGRGRSAALTAERLVNMYAEKAEIQAKSPTVLHGTPALDLFAAVNGEATRGVHVMGGTTYTVIGNHLYSVSSDATSTSLGYIGGTGYVQMADNGTQLVVVAPPDGYVYTTTLGLIQIPDTDWPGATSVSYMDGYFIFSSPAQGQWFISALYDGTSYDALDFATAEASPDRLVRVFVDHRELWLFGESTAEVWTNQGTSPFPFARYDGAISEKGLGAVNSVAKVDNSIFWLDQTGVVRRAQGYDPARISTHSIEYQVSRGTWTEAEAFTYTQEGHEFYVLKVPGAGTYVYDAATTVWHERESYGLEPGWRARDCVQAYGKLLVGDSHAGNLYALNLDKYAEDTQIVSEMIFPPINHDGSRFTIHSVQLDMETGVKDAQASLSISRDGLTWSSEIWQAFGGSRTMNVVWNRCGQHRNAHLRFRISSPAKRAVYTAYAEIEPDQN